MGRWPREKSVRAGLRGGKEARIRMGNEEHEQSQREHPKEVLPRGARLLAGMCTTWGRKGSPSTCDL